MVIIPDFSDAVASGSCVITVARTCVIAMRHEEYIAPFMFIKRFSCLFLVLKCYECECRTSFRFQQRIQIYTVKELIC